MTDRNDESSTMGTTTQLQPEARAECAASPDAWYASLPARRGGLETGARGWRWLVTNPATQAQAMTGA